MVGILTENRRGNWISSKRNQFKSFLILSSAITLGLIVLHRLSFCGKDLNADRHTCLKTDSRLKESEKKNINIIHSDENIAWPRLNIVAQFPVIINGSDITELTFLRQKEYLEALVKNLAHPQVEQVHLLLEKRHDRTFIESLNLTRRDKIVFYELNHRMCYGDAMRYVSDFLIKRTAVIINADCYLGHGFENLDPAILLQGTVYALTRHETPQAVTHCDARDLCSPLAKYIGSHDAFVMHPNKPLPEELIEKLMVRPDIVGVEKFVIFLLRTTGSFQVKNPCRFLYIFHNHCTKLRHSKLRLINGKRLNKVYIPNIPPWRSFAPFSRL